MEQSQKPTVKDPKDKKTVKATCYYCGHDVTVEIPEGFFWKNKRLRYRYLSNYLNFKPIFCSSECESKFQNQQKAIEKESVNLRRPSHMGIKKECPRCGRIFKRYRLWCPKCRGERLREVVVYD
jgi:rRNA maturation protein Nop10